MALFIQYITIFYFNLDDYYGTVNRILCAKLLLVKKYDIIYLNYLEILSKINKKGLEELLVYKSNRSSVLQFETLKLNKTISCTTYILQNKQKRHQI